MKLFIKIEIIFFAVSINYFEASVNISPVRAFLRIIIIIIIIINVYDISVIM